jgi:hypothetical protein
MYDYAKYATFNTLSHFIHSLLYLGRFEYPKFVVKNRENTREYKVKLQKLKNHTKQRQMYFSPRTVTRWNQLPRDVAKASSLDSFKNKFDKHMHPFWYCLVEHPIQFYLIRKPLE